MVGDYRMAKRTHRNIAERTKTIQVAQYDDTDVKLLYDTDSEIEFKFLIALIRIHILSFKRFSVKEEYKTGMM